MAKTANFLFVAVWIWPP